MIDFTTRTVDFDTPLKRRRLYLILIGFSILVGCSDRRESETKTSTAFDPAVAQLVPSGIALDRHILESVPIKPRTEDDPVAAQLSTSPTSAAVGEGFELSVVLRIAPGYEIHSSDVSAPLIPTLLKLELPPGFTAFDEWESPAPVRSIRPDGGSVYFGEAKFLRKINISNDTEPGDYLLACSVSYQACNSRQCLRPVESLLSITMSISP